MSQRASFLYRTRVVFKIGNELLVHDSIVLFPLRWAAFQLGKLAKGMEPVTARAYITMQFQDHALQYITDG